VKKVFIITIALTLAGCVGTGEAMKTWLGHDEAKVLASWGAPDKTAHASGKTFHTWDARNGYGQIICTKTFVIDSGIIKSYSTNCL
jgi:hypothetical protein